ncbi:MAG: hypothetical protein CMB80_20760 [Flammeovirgaceae bacterium]|nr:hypothetical protein [Flammeovirgaceae bacterium]MBE63725.1 hypothetical protein [Flammeovirgaceae bacterium]MBR07095.1 hypothetical protein [Rickettsiales bacterium]
MKGHFNPHGIPNKITRCSHKMSLVLAYPPVGIYSVINNDDRVIGYVVLALNKRSERQANGKIYSSYYSLPGDIKTTLSDQIFKTLREAMNSVMLTGLWKS